MTDRVTLSVPETAAALGVSDDLVYELIARGELPSIVLGRRKVVPRRAIDMVIDRALADFDPDALLTSLAAAAGSDDGGLGRSTSPSEPTGTANATVHEGTARSRGAEPSAAAVP